MEEYYRFLVKTRGSPTLEAAAASFRRGCWL